MASPAVCLKHAAHAARAPHAEGGRGRAALKLHFVVRVERKMLNYLSIMNTFF